MERTINDVYTITVKLSIWYLLLADRDISLGHGTCKFCSFFRVQSFSDLFAHLSLACSISKRGVSEQGKVANDVEHEQILHDESTSGSSGCFSSFIQVRGSVPVFWVQVGGRACVLHFAF